MNINANLGNGYALPSSFFNRTRKIVAKTLIVSMLVLDIPVVPLINYGSSAQAAALLTDPNVWVTVTPKADPMMQNLNIPANAATQGMWSAPFAWPMNGLHNMILPDGKVLTFGTNANGDAQDGRTFDIWDPSLGFGANSHNTSYQAEQQDSFCSTATYLNDGNMLITGGNAGNGGYGKGSVIYNPVNNTRAAAQAVTALPRWYSTMIGLPDGRKLVMGGMTPYAEGMFNDPAGAIARGEPSMTPEIYDNGAWRSLFGANSRLAFGPDFLRTSFPHAFVAPNGLVFGISADRMWYLDVNTNNGNGAVYDYGQFKPGYGNKPDPDNVGALSVAVMYDIGKIIQVGGNGGFNGDGLPSSNKATNIDINGGAPVLTELPRMSIPRRYGNGIVLANGEVVITGGTRFGNEGGGNAVYAAEIWNPAFNFWRLGASASTIRVYHSISSLLLNGTIISTGGGTPGPVLNKTGEVYYPPYLFEQVGGASRLAARPAIRGISGLKYAHGATMQLDMDSTAAISGLSLIALSNGTHSFNNSQRRIPLQFKKEDNRLTATIPNANLTPPGYYQVVALNAQGVPSYANVIAVGAQMAAPQVATTRYNPGTVTPPPPPANVPPTVALTAPVAGAAFNQGATINISANAADSDGSIAYVDFYDGGTLVGSAVNAPYAFNWVTDSTTTIGAHTITAKAYDNAGAVATSAAVTVSVTALSSTADTDGDGIVDALDLYPNDAARGAGIWREQYNNIGFGVTVADLIAAAKFPNAPDVVAKMTTFTSPNDLGDAYGSRIRGIFTAPQTGAYTFWVAGDDEVRLYLSTDSRAVNKRQIAFVPGWSFSNEWAKYPEQKSVTINLIAGQSYYLEALQKEGGGGDGVAVAWQTPTNNAITVMTDQLFRPAANTLISQGKPVSQSSVDYGGVASRAVDGNTSGIWGDNSTTHTAYENQPWLQVDLGQSSPLSSVTVWNRTDCCSDRLQNFYVLVSNNDMTGKTLAQLLADPTVKSTQVASLNGATNTTVQIGNTSARYVRVQLSGTDFLSLGEVQVYSSNTVPPLPTVFPTASTQITYETRAGVAGRVWVVNPDNNSVSVLNATTNTLEREIPVGLAPRTLAIAPNGNIWVTNKMDSTVSIVSPISLAVVQTINLPRASQPHGLAFAPDGKSAYVVLEASGQLLKLDPANGNILAALAVGNNPRHVSVTADSATALVSRFITPSLPGEGTATIDTTTAGAEVLAVNAGAMTLNKTIVLRHSDKADTTITGSGVPNYLGAVAISPDGKSAWVPSKQDNIKRGIARNGQPLNFQNTVRAISSRINMTTLAEDYALRVDHDNSSLGSAALYHPNGTYLFVALETSRQVAIINPTNGALVGNLDTGLAPQGLAIAPDGSKLFVQNFMSRTVSIYNLAALNGQANVAGVTLQAQPSTINTEKLPANVLAGKQLFYDAKDPRLALDSYMSCASCHNDGGHDGRVWDLTGFGEGLRNTINLKGRAAMGHGNLHWSANFDELQDFEGQIRTLSGGTGLMTDAQFNTGTRNQALGDKKAGVSADLDNLAAYVASLNTFAQSPNRNADGTLTAAATAGKAVFANSCASCHGGVNFTTSTDGTNLKNIGTINALSGKRLNATLAGIDVPTLRDLWATAPYLHNGSAATVTAAVQAHNNLTLNATDLTNVVAYVQQIGSEEAAVAVTPPSNPTGDTDGDGIVDALDLYPNDAARGAGIWREQYNAIGAGDTVADLTSAAKYPNAPDVVAKMTTFTSPDNIGDNYGSRIRGIFTAPATGAYTFWVAGDNEVRLYLSTDNTAAKKTQIAYVPGWTFSNEWTKYPEQKSVTINLVAGQNYYLEVLHKEGWGGDGVAVAWQTPSNPTLTVMTDQFFQKAGGSVTPPPANVAPTVALTAPATGTAITQGATVAITATAADSDGTVARVEFYDGATLLGTDTTAPYAFNWVTSTATTTGTYSLTARAYDNTGAVTTSAAVTIGVNAPQQPTAPITVTVPNYNFEAQVLADGALGAMDGWTGGSGTFNPSTIWYTTLAGNAVVGTMAGQNAAYLYGAGAAPLQTNTNRTIATGDNYTLTVSIGNRTTAEVFGGAVIQLLANGNVVATSNVTTPPTGQGNFGDVSLSWTAPASANGAVLGIRISIAGGTYLDIDNVRVTGTTAGTTPPPNNVTTASLDCASKRNVAGSDVILLMGQSNMSGYGQGYNAAIDGPNNPRIQQWSRANTIITASEHLEHADHNPGSTIVGMGTSFGRAYLATLPAQRNVLLVPTAYGGTGLVNGPWSPGGNLFEDAMTRMQAALNSNAGNCVAAVLWHQGEDDSLRNISQASYQQAWSNMISTMRSRIPTSAKAPVILGEFTPAWIAQNQQITAPILSAIRAIPASVGYTAVASSSSVTSTNPGDIIHFDAAALRSYGQVYFNQLSNALQNVK